MALVEEYKFASLFINQFFPRPGTPAAKMPRVHPQEVRNGDDFILKTVVYYYTVRSCQIPEFALCVTICWSFAFFTIFVFLLIQVCC